MLHLSTRWDFASLRKLALKSINPPTPHDQLVLARTYSVEHWVLPALTALCSRTLPLSLEEAQQMGMEDVILVATAREEIRGGALRVDVADIPRIVKTKAKAELAKLEAETMTKAGAETKAKAEASTKAEAETREEHEAGAKAKAEAEAREKAEAEARETQEADAKIAEEAKVKAAKEARYAVAKTELEAKKKAEKERLELEAKSIAEATGAKLRAELRAKQAEEQIALQRAAYTAARAAAMNSATSASNPMSPTRGSDGSWFGKISAAASAVTEETPTHPLPTNPWAKRQLKNTSSPSTELGSLRSPAGPGPSKTTDASKICDSRKRHACSR